MRIVISRWYWTITWSALIIGLLILCAAGKIDNALHLFLSIPFAILTMYILRLLLLWLATKFEGDEYENEEICATNIGRYERQVTELLRRYGAYQPWEWTCVVDARLVREHRNRPVSYPIKLCGSDSKAYVVFYHNAVEKVVMLDGTPLMRHEPIPMCQPAPPRAETPPMQTKPEQAEDLYDDIATYEDGEPDEMDWETEDDSDYPCTDEVHAEAVAWLNDNRKVYDSDCKNSSYVVQPEKLPTDRAVWHEIKRIVVDASPDISVTLTDSTILFMY